MRAIPVTKPLGEVCDVIGGGTPAKDRAEFYGGNIPWATVRDMRGDFIADTEFKITPFGLKSSSTNVIPKNNVVIATRVGLGKVCVLQQDTAINQDLRAVIPRSNKEVFVPYLFWWLKSISHVIVAQGTGATVQGVKLPFIKSLPFPILRYSEQQRIVSILEEAFAGLATATASAEKNFKNAHEIFDSYLNSIFTRKGAGWLTRNLGEEVKFIDYRGKTPPKRKVGIRLITAKNVKMTRAAAAHPVPRRPQHPGRSGLQRLLGVWRRRRAGASEAGGNSPARPGPKKRQHLFHYFSDIHERRGCRRQTCAVHR